MIPLNRGFKKNFIIILYKTNRSFAGIYTEAHTGELRDHTPSHRNYLVHHVQPI